MKIHFETGVYVPGCEEVYEDICELIERKGLCSDMSCRECVFDSKKILNLFIKEVNSKE